MISQDQDRKDDEDKGEKGKIEWWYATQYFHITLGWLGSLVEHYLGKMINIIFVQHLKDWISVWIKCYLVQVI